MISKRIKYIASLIDKNDKILDVGTDHALLPIYLIKNNIVKVADGSDISANVVDNAINNIKNLNLNNKINIYLSDGLKNIDLNKYNTLIICGMGFNTIKKILDEKQISNIEKLIIQSNNNNDLNRKYLNSINYKIVSDIYLMDKHKIYNILVLKKGIQKLSDNEYLYGIYNADNQWFYNEELKKLRAIENNIPEEKKSIFKSRINCLENYISKEKTEEKK